MPIINNTRMPEKVWDKEDEGGEREVIDALGLG